MAIARTPDYPQAMKAKGSLKPKKRKTKCASPKRK